jgi:hypothetical protein
MNRSAGERPAPEGTTRREEMHIGEIVREVEVMPVAEPVFEEPIDDPAPVTEPAWEPAAP